MLRTASCIPWWTAIYGKKLYDSNGNNLSIQTLRPKSSRRYTKVYPLIPNGASNRSPSRLPVNLMIMPGPQPQPTASLCKHLSGTASGERIYYRRALSGARSQTLGANFSFALLIWIFFCQGCGFPTTTMQICCTAQAQVKLCSHTVVLYSKPTCLFFAARFIIIFVCLGMGWPGSDGQACD